METTLHQQLKRCYADGASNTEVTVGRYRIDAVRDDELIEVQCASLSAIRDKSNQLLKRHKLRVVKPVIARTRITKIKKPGGKPTSRRMSPKRGNILDLFEDLIYFTRVFPNPNLVLEVPMIHVEQFRMPAKRRRRRRWGKDYSVHDVQLEQIEHRYEFHEAADLLTLFHLPEKDDFNTADLAKAIDRPRWVAQQIAYVLRNVGAIETAGRNRSGIRYASKAAA
tara:strand:- start:51424 stop:52095 length:672 start_codon:yes stop_codon:yes gene_type:complete